MIPLNANTDPEYNVPASETSLSRFFKSMIRDERDLPFIYLTIKISAILFPLAALLYMPFVPFWIFWPAAIVYLVINNKLKSPFGLMAHCAAHRTLFNKKFHALNFYFPWVLAPFFGQSPETYFAHHIVMHHPENNLPEDKSCTMFYQRDSKRDFSRYWLSFFFTGVFQLAIYFIHKKKYPYVFRVVAGEFIFLGGCIGLCFLNWQATLVVFIIPFLASRLVMMAGNWVQHAFVSAEQPDNAYMNSITCINTKFNHNCWNDGYHASHHIRPGMHWTEHPAYFRSTLDEFAKNNAVVFDGIDYTNVFAWLMAKRYDLLANHFVNVGNRFNSDEEVIALLKERTKKIPRPYHAVTAASQA